MPRSTTSTKGSPSSCRERAARSAELGVPASTTCQLAFDEDAREDGAQVGLVVDQEDDAVPALFFGEGFELGQGRERFVLLGGLLRQLRRIRGRRCPRAEGLLRDRLRVGTGGHRLRRLGEARLDRRGGVSPVLVHAPRELQQELLGLDAVLEGFRADFTAVDGGGHLRGEAEQELSLPQPHQLLEGRLDPLSDERGTLPGRELRHSCLDGRRVGRETAHDQAALEHDGRFAAGRRDREVARLLAEGHDLDDVEEGEVLEPAVQTHRRPEVIRARAGPSPPQGRRRRPRARAQ